MKHVLTKRAERRAQFVDGWWRSHRPRTPDRFQSELDEAIRQILGAPLVPPVRCVEHGREYRRVLLPKTKQFVYYTVDVAKQLVIIAYVWGGRRGREPKL